MGADVRLLDGPPVTAGPVDPAGPPDAEVLIREARRLRRRRWAIGGAVVVLVAAAASGLGLVLAPAGTPRAPVQGAAPRAPPASSNGTTARSSVVPEQPTATAVAPDGALYVADAKRDQVLERLADGKFVVVAVGTGRQGFPANGATARRTTIEPVEDMLFSHGGVLYLAEQVDGRPRIDGRSGVDGRAEISSVAPDGTVETVVGGGTACRIGPSGTPARKVEFEHIEALTFGPGGNLYFVGNTCSSSVAVPLFELTPAGRVVPVPLPTTQEVVRCSPTAATFATDGDLYLACFGSKDILVVAPDKGVTSIADTYPYDEFGGLVEITPGAHLHVLWKSRRA